MVVQVSGKVRGKIEVNSDTTKEEMEAKALEIDNVKKYLEDFDRSKYTSEIRNKFENEISTSLEILRIYKTNLSINLDNTDHIYYYLTVSFGVEAYEGYLKWCKEAKEMLKKLC